MVSNPWKSASGRGGWRSIGLSLSSFQRSNDSFGGGNRLQNIGAGEVVDYTRARPTFRHQADPLKPGQVPGERGLANRSQNPQIVDAVVPLTEGIQNLDANGMSQRFENIGICFGCLAFHTY
jgi:hypothetical protein